MDSPPINDPLVSRQTASLITSPAWVLWFQKLFRSLGTCWNDLNQSALSLAKTGPSSPTLTAINGTTVQALAFTGTGVQINEAWGSFELLHDYLEGTGIEPHVHWTPATNGAGNVKWLMDYHWVEQGATFGAATTISAVAVAPGLTPWGNLRTDLGHLSGANRKIGSRFVFRLYRNPADAADTYAADALVLDVGIHYQRDALGSHSEYVK